MKERGPTESWFRRMYPPRGGGKPGSVDRQEGEEAEGVAAAKKTLETACGRRILQQNQNPEEDRRKDSAPSPSDISRALQKAMVGVWSRQRGYGGRSELRPSR